MLYKKIPIYSCQINCKFTIEILPLSYVAFSRGDLHNIICFVNLTAMMMETYDTRDQLFLCICGIFISFFLCPPLIVTVGPHATAKTAHKCERIYTLMMVMLGRRNETTMPCSDAAIFHDPVATPRCAMCTKCFFIAEFSYSMFGVIMKCRNIGHNQSKLQLGKNIYRFERKISFRCIDFSVCAVTSLADFMGLGKLIYSIFFIVVSIGRK